jgi:hypothetical protein
MYCRDLAAVGYSYVDAVAYWMVEGQPDRMDADRNGIPCQTVYPHDDVVAFWGDPLPVPTSPPDVFYSLVLSMEQGLLAGSGGAYGSGCTPGSGPLPDGVWFGWVIEFRPEELIFDMGCLWPSMEDTPGPTNTAIRLRTVPVNPATVVYPLDDEGGGWTPVRYDAWPGPVGWCPPGAMSPSFPDGCLWWLAVNGGTVTEMFEFWVP